MGLVHNYSHDVWRPMGGSQMMLIILWYLLSGNSCLWIDTRKWANLAVIGRWKSHSPGRT